MKNKSNKNFKVLDENQEVNNETTVSTIAMIRDVFLYLNSLLFFCFISFIILQLLPICKFKYIIIPSFIIVFKLFLFYLSKELTKKIRVFCAIVEIFTFKIFNITSIIIFTFFTIYYVNMLLSCLIIDLSKNFLLLSFIIFSFIGFIILLYNFISVTRLNSLLRFCQIKDRNELLISLKRKCHINIILSYLLYILYLSYLINTKNLFYFVYFSAVYIFMTILLFQKIVVKFMNSSDFIILYYFNSNYKIIFLMMINNLLFYEYLIHTTATPGNFKTFLFDNNYIFDKKTLWSYFFG